MKRPTEVISKIKHHVPLKYSGELQDLYDYIIFLENLTKTERAKTIDEFLARVLYDNCGGKCPPNIEYCYKCVAMRVAEQMNGAEE